MKCLFVIGSLQGGGAERFLSVLCNELSELGHEVILIYNKKHKEYYVSPKVREIDSYSFEANTYEGTILKRYYNKVLNRYRDYRFFKQFIKEEKPDVVISFLMNWAITLYAICKGKVPLVFSHRSTIKRRMTNIVAKFVKQYIYPRADMVTLMSYYDQAYLRDELPNTIVLQNPVSYQPISKEEYMDIFPKRRNILACGRLLEVKGFDLLIKAFSIIAGKYPNWNLNILGKDGQNSNYSCYLRSLIKELNLEKRVHFLGFRKDVNEIMKSHSIFCLSSRFEGFPNALAEAMAMGMATVSFDVTTGPRDIIIDGLDGLIVKNQDVDALAEGIEMLILDEDLRKSFGLHAIENIKRFNLKRMIAKWEKMLLDVSRKE